MDVPTDVDDDNDEMKQPVRPQEKEKKKDDARISKHPNETKQNKQEVGVRAQDTKTAQATNGERGSQQPHQQQQQQSQEEEGEEEHRDADDNHDDRMDVDERPHKIPASSSSGMPRLVVFPVCASV